MNKKTAKIEIKKMFDNGAGNYMVIMMMRRAGFSHREAADLCEEVNPTPKKSIEQQTVEMAEKEMLRGAISKMMKI